MTATYRIKIELAKERVRRQLDIKYSYFLPFKYSSDEFRRRLLHLNDRLTEKGTKHNEMVRRFKQNINQSHDIDWYFNDEVRT